ncbi:MAG: FCD domain-containing protein [Pseudomonadota bacterium]
MFQRIEQVKVSDAVARQIEALILEGVLKPGDKLPPERELAKTLEVSRPSLRDALNELEQRRLLIARQGGGTYVADVMGSVFAEPIVPLFGKHEKATADYLEFRQQVEGIAASYAAQRATPADRTILEGIFGRMEAAHDRQDAEEEARLDVEFHSAIVDAGHNIVLIQTLRSIYALLKAGVFHNRKLLYENPGARDRLLDQHRAIYFAVLNGDAEAAKLAAEQHMTYVIAARDTAERAHSRQITAERRLETVHRTGTKRARAAEEAV